MKKISISLSEKRFLIIWIGICAFAYFMNIAEINGTVCEINQPNQCSDFWTSGEDKDDFYPFTQFYVDYSFLQLKPDANPFSGTADYSRPYSDFNRVEGRRFKGIFKSFDFIEFAIYSFLGLAIIFIPKIWK